MAIVKEAPVDQLHAARHIHPNRVREEEAAGGAVFSYMRGSFLFDVDSARELAGDGREPVEVEEESVRGALADLDPGHVCLSEFDAAVGIIAHVVHQGQHGHVLIDGHRSAARCLNNQRPFFAHVLSEEESQAILLRSPADGPVEQASRVSAEVEEATTRAYADKFQASQPWAERSARVIAGAATHDRRGFGPFGVYVDRAEGARKWDMAGQPLLDYWMGHGALLCGHGFAPVMEAVARQLGRGTHYGASHPLEVRWAELVCRLIPSAEKVRFTASGTEATLLALRVARAFTGRQLVLKFDGHFHGWHDEAMAHFYPEAEAGFNPGAVSRVGLASLANLDGILTLIEKGQVAAVLLEPAGGSAGGLPWQRDFLLALRQATRAHGTLLIFDEVISGFRHSPGGFQQSCGIMPDLTTLAKILCGGLPGGAVAGRADVMAVFGTGTRRGERLAKVPHTGTFNANPLSAAAGIAMLEHIADGMAQARARAAAERLAHGVNQAAEDEGVDVFLYTNGSSIYHTLIGARAAGIPLGPSTAVVDLQKERAAQYALLRRALLLEGIDTHPVHGWVSAIHDDAVIDASVEAFGRAFRRVGSVEGFVWPH